MTLDEPHRQAEPRDRPGGLEHRGAARHVELHVAHLVAGLDRDAAGVERHGLADQAEHRALRPRGLVAQRDQPRLLVGALRDGGEGAHPRGLDVRAVHHLDRQAVELVGQRLRPLGQVRGRHVVGGRVLEVARGVDRLGDHAPVLDRHADVVVRGHGQLREPVRLLVVGGALVGAERVGRHRGALDEGLGVGVGDVVGQLPAQVKRAQLGGAPLDPGGGHAGALGIELVAPAEPGQHVAAPVRVGDGELAEAALGLARSRSAPAAPRRRRREPRPRPRRSRWRSCRHPCPPGQRLWR